MTALVDLPWPLRTPRLELDLLSEPEIDAVFAYWSVPAVGEWIGRLAPDRDRHAEECRETIARGVRLVVRHDSAVVGDLFVETEAAWGQREADAGIDRRQARLGWTFAPAAGGRGLATEALRAVLGVCFDGLGVRRVVAECFADNEPSWRLMERVGMRREGHGVRDSLHRTRGWLDGYTYALLAEEWAAAG